MMSLLAHWIAKWLFLYRRSVLLAFAVITAVLCVSATQLRVDAGFNKMIPLEHPYMKTFVAYQNIFGGANRLIVAVMREDGRDIYEADFLATLKQVTDEVFFIPGVDRSSVTSLFTPNVRFIEVVEEGFAGGNVIPASYAGTPQDLEIVRKNVLKSGNVGRLVANDSRGALVRATLLDVDPATGRRLDYQQVAERLEALRARFEKDRTRVHIIGFAKAVGDIRDGTVGVIGFFALACALTFLLLHLYSRSLKLTALAIACAGVPVLWLLGLLPLLGYGIDPLSILVPFLIFSIGLSHAVQMTNAWKHEVAVGTDSIGAARAAFSKLFVPGALALLTNALGFLVMLHVRIEVVRELAITASLGVALMILTNKLLLPVLLSYLAADDATRRRAERSGQLLEGLWAWVASSAKPAYALSIIAGTSVLLAVGTWHARDLKTGDLGNGIPELHDRSRYNRDNAAIIDSFAVGVDVISVIVQTRDVPGACTDHAVMDAVDRFEMHMRNVYGVQSVVGLAGIAKTVHAGWNEGSLKWRALSRNRDVLAQSVAQVETATGLLNSDCSAMQILIFTRGHQGTTIRHIVSEIKKHAALHNSDRIQFLLASGNVGVMAATNEAVDAAEASMLASIFAAVMLLCWLTFRSWRAVLCITVPLALVAILCNALMAALGIGLKVSTLPVIALGVGVGVDYGIYLYERLQHHIGRGVTAALHDALRERGSAIVFTAITMTVGVASWGFSALKFQADMGILLAFMFLVNMLGALLLLPALAALLLPNSSPAAPAGTRGALA